MAEKSVSTSFRVRAAPESWSKYTTPTFYALVDINHQTPPYPHCVAKFIIIPQGQSVFHYFKYDYQEKLHSI